MKNTKKFLSLLLAGICLICLATGCKGPQGSASIVTNTPTPIITPSSTLEPTVKPTEQPTPEITATPVTTITPTAEPTPTATPEPTVEPTVKPTAKPTVHPTAKPTTKPTSKPTVKPTATPSATKKPTVVQKANINTGISWDGVSPIIYTYPDGSTGTEKRVGAKYEAYPGVIYTVEKADIIVATASPIATFNPICSYCSKTQGNGTNGTCVRWLMGDVDCPNCGEHVQVRTCHTCKGITPTPDVIRCIHCGKVAGDGRNGTCIRYSMLNKDMPCPSCGQNIPARTCHTCSE